MHSTHEKAVINKTHILINCLTFTRINYGNILFFLRYFLEFRLSRIVLEKRKYHSNLHPYKLKVKNMEKNLPSYICK